LQYWCRNNGRQGRAGQYRKGVTERVPIGMTVVRTTEGRTDGEVVGVVGVVGLY